VATLKELRAEGRTVLLSSHNMTELDGLCDSVTVMRQGKAVWHGSMRHLRAQSPAPANRLWTSDDPRAEQVAASSAHVSVIADPGGWLVLSGDPDAVDDYVLSLGRAGIAVRRLEPSMSALESMFFTLTGQSEAPVSESSVADAGAVS
jgi:ABC-2 type transport system ATP-binding protein